MTNSQSLEDLELSDIGRDPRYANGQWLGIVLLIAAPFLAALLLAALAWFN